MVLTGPVCEADKWSLAARCDGIRVTVAARVVLAGAARGMERRSSGGRERALRGNGRALLRTLGAESSFGSYAEFEVVLDMVLADPKLRGVLGERGRRYVDANFRWPVIIDSYDRSPAA